MAEQENILTRLGKLFQNQIVVRKTPTGQLKIKDVNLSDANKNEPDNLNKVTEKGVRLNII